MLGFGTCLPVGMAASLLFSILPLPARPASKTPQTREYHLRPGFPILSPIRFVLKATNLGVWGRAPSPTPKRRLRRYSQQYASVSQSR